jgi:galactosylceramidase
VAARSLDKSLRNSEGGPWRGDWEGFGYLVKLYNRNYIEGRATNVITWSLVTSYYDNLSIPNSGLMYAKTPWSGYFEVQPAIWAAAHTTQFAEPGWRYIDSGCGYLNKGSYVTLKSPDNKDFSIIIETIDTTGLQSLTFETDPLFNNRKMHVWKTTVNKGEFEQQPDIKIWNNKFTIELEGKSAYSITTTTGQRKGFYSAPENKPFPFPYRTGFEEDSIGQLARYFMDQAGVFEVQKRSDGTGNCLKQILDHQGIEWEVSHNPAIETILGDTSWTDYEIRADVMITENTGSAKLLGRIMDTKRGTDYPDGYTFIVTTGNKWTLMEGNNVIGSGWAEFSPFKWHHLQLRIKGNNITAFVDRKEAVSVVSKKYSHGLAGIGSGLNFAEFDNFEVVKPEQYE